MVKETSEEVEASGDSIVLAEALGYIGDGLHAIARSIEKLAVVNAGDEDEPQDDGYYMDGKRKE